MIHVIIMIASLMFTIGFAFRNKWQFAEMNALNSNIAQKANKKWHSWQAVVQLAFYVIIGLSTHEAYGIATALLYLSFFWLLFDGILNKVALNKPFFYVGTTAFIDKQFQRFKRPQLAIAIVKISLIVVFLIPYIIKAVNK